MQHHASPLRANIETNELEQKAGNLLMLSSDTAHPCHLPIYPLRERVLIGPLEELPEGRGW